MTQNMGIIDRIVRVVIAAVIAVLIVLNVLSVPLAIVLGIVGGIFVLTSIVGFCPIYFPFKISTKKK